MTNEQKEQLKNFVEGLKYGSIGWYCHDGTYAITEGANKNVETILALIDRVPSEGHLKLINMVLSQINSREMWATRADYEMARMALDRIRTALCLEGKE